MRRPSVSDIVVAAALLAAGVAATFGAEGGPDAAALGFTVAYTVPLAFRHVFPLAAPSLSVVAILAFGLAIENVSQPTIPLAVGLAAYTIGHDVPMPASGVVALVLLAGFWSTMLATDAPAGDLVFVVLNYGAPWLFGRVLRDRADAAQAGRAQAVEDERARIARELHDVVAHTLSVVAVQTQAVQRRLAPHQDREAADLRGVEGAVRDAMVEMRRLFGVLRANGAAAPLAPQPGLADVDDLLADARAAGFEVHAEILLSPADVPPGVGLTAYRIVQEALTNVRRHAHARTIVVHINGDGQQLEIEVSDDGTGPTAGSAGHGILGMRERVRLYGGSLEAGSAPGGGFRIRARLPVPGGRS